MQVYGKNYIPEEEKHHCSYRSKLSGLVRGISQVSLLCKKYHIVDWTLVSKCNSSKAILKADKYDYPPSTSLAHFDIISTLYWLIKSCVGKISFYHVKEYQDKYTKDLSIWKRLNIITDTRAKVALWKMIVNNHKSSPL